ncbi:hypothetical protein MTO96_027102 [Rhipicephalus appendiculatus]
MTRAMAFVHLSSSSIFFLALCSYRQDAARGAPAHCRRSLQPPDIWTSSGLVKDLSLGGPMEGLLKVVYGSRVSVVINGSLTPSQTSRQPQSVSLHGARECVPPFTLIMVDPDAPKPQRSDATQLGALDGDQRQQRGGAAQG